MRHSKCLILFVIALIAAFEGSSAHAIGLRFWPSNISVQAKPGQTISRTFNLTLAKDSAASRFQARVEDWWRSPDNNQTFYAVAGTLKRSCGKWCVINPVESSVKPGETMTIKVSIRVPEDAQPGGYWAALTVDEIRDPSAPKPLGVGMIMKSSVSVGIFVEVGDVTRSAKLVGVRVADGRVAVTLRNTGNTPLRIDPTFEFYKPGEEKLIAKVRVGAEPLVPEPNDTCEFSSPLPPANDLPSGKYKVRVIVDAGLDYLMGAEKELEVVREKTADSRP